MHKGGRQKESFKKPQNLLPRAQLIMLYCVTLIRISKNKNKTQNTPLPLGAYSPEKFASPNEGWASFYMTRRDPFSFEFPLLLWLLGISGQILCPILRTLARAEGSEFT